MSRYRTTFSSTVKPETLKYIDSKTDKSKGISRGDVMDSLVEDAKQREKCRTTSDLKSEAGGNFPDLRSVKSKRAAV